MPQGRVTGWVFSWPNHFHSQLCSQTAGQAGSAQWHRARKRLARLGQRRVSRWRLPGSVLISVSNLFKKWMQREIIRATTFQIWPTLAQPRSSKPPRPQAGEISPLRLTLQQARGHSTEPKLSLSPSLSGKQLGAALHLVKFNLLFMSALHICKVQGFYAPARPCQVEAHMWLSSSNFFLINFT